MVASRRVLAFGRRPFPLLAGTLVAAFLTASGVAPSVAGAAQATAPPPSQEGKPVFATGTATVVLDVVVRDKKGRPVPDIQAGELEVYEEGAKQAIDSFKRIETELPVVEGVAPQPAVRPDGSRQLNLVTFVFDQLGETGRRLAQKAAESFLEKGLRPNTFVAVFRVDNRLSMVLAFTNDRAKLKEAIARSTSGTFVGVTDEKAALEQAVAELERTASLGTADGQAAAGQGGAFAARAQAQALSNMLRLANTLQRQQMGGTSLYPLLALAKGQQTLAGRKTLIYVSERLDVPPSLEQVYRSVISEANRANVSVYAIDARGLDAERALGATRDALDDARRVSQDTMESMGAGAVSKDEVKLSETAEGALRANTQQTMQDLAESTGGFLISNTNSFRPGSERIAADIAAYYQITYVPPPSPFDGRFRKIEVRVSRKDVVVQTRSGYFALPPGEASAVLPYEVPLLGALSVASPPHDFAMRVGVLRFGVVPGGLDHKIVVEVPISGLKMTTDAATARYRLHLSLVALVKGEGGAIVERYSEDYPFEGPAERAEGLKLGNVLFKRRLPLPAGRYTLEVAGQDRETGQTSVSRTPIVVPASTEAVRISSVSLIRKLDQVPPGQQSDDPLDYQSMRIIPNLDAPISLAANPKLWLFFAAYPAKGAPDTPKMTLEFQRDGQPIGRAAVPLPAADPDGVVRYVGQFPTTRFTPGTYEARIVLAQAGASCEERASFTIVP